MAVSKIALGLNARNYLYIRPFNGRRAKRRADNKLLTKRALVRNDIPTPQLLAIFKTFRDARAFDWTKLKGSFVLKPARGYGGGGIMVVRNWDGERGKRIGGKEVTIQELETEIFGILDGAYSLDNLPDTAFIEKRVIVSSAMRKLAKRGVPDVRVIVAHRVPIMAMLRLPTVHSDGKANLHQGALGIGIDLRTGITTKGILYGDDVVHIPDTKMKVRGIKIPQWDQILKYATQAQEVSGLGYAGIDIVLDEEEGPLVLEVNARPGLQIQLANGASLRTRLDRLEDMRVPSTEFGIDLAQRLFAEHALSDVRGDTKVLHIVEKIALLGPNGKKKVVRAKIDTGAYRTAIDEKLVKELEFPTRDERVHVRSGSGKQYRHTARVRIRLRGKEIETVASFSDRTHMTFPVIIGRRDIKGYLVDPTVYPEDVK